MAKKKKKNKKEEKVKVVKKELTSEEKITQLNDKHLRLFAEFENFKKRTAKERMDLYKKEHQLLRTKLRTYKKKLINTKLIFLSLVYLQKLINSNYK